MFKYENNCYNSDIGEMIVATELIKNNIINYYRLYK